MAICKRTHRYNERLSDLPDNQGGDQRHKCPGCTYEMGLHDGENNRGMRQIDWEQVDESQAGTGRHKDAENAYIVGYADGSQKRRTPNQAIYQG